MKKLCLIVVLAALLAGCGKKNYETRNTPCNTDATAAPGVISIMLPDQIATPVMSTQNGDRLYIAENYEICLQTISSTDLNTTLKSCTGFERDKLTIMETEQNGMKRYDCAWSAAGEGVQSVGRLMVLDDGNYHYVLTVTAPQEHADEMDAAWKELEESFRVSIVQ